MRYFGILIILFFLITICSAQVELNPRSIVFDPSTIEIEIQDIDELHIKNLYNFSIAGRRDYRGKIIHSATEHIFKNIDGDTTLRMDNDGILHLPTYKYPNPNTLGLRSLFIRSDGSLVAGDGPSQRLEIHYADFVPGEDGDDLGEVTIAVHRNHGFAQASGNFSDNGSLLAPIRAERGGLMFSFRVTYINDSDDSFILSVLEENRETSASSNLSNANVIVSESLGKGGFYRKGSFVETAIVSHSFGIPAYSLRSSRQYTLKLECNDCSNQYIKSVTIYTY